MDQDLVKKETKGQLLPEDEDNEVENGQCGEAMDVAEGDSTQETNTENQARDFSSENFKIVVENLPKFFGFAQAKKIFNKKLNLDAHKIKPTGPGNNHMYICFKNEEAKDKAMKVLDGFSIRGRKIEVQSAVAVKDPFLSKKKDTTVVEDNRSIEERLQSVICPYANLSYEEQLNKKQNDVRAIVKKMGEDIRRANNRLADFVKSNVIGEDGSLPVLQEIVPSPRTTGYRNKCEFSIGYAHDTVGQVDESAVKSGDSSDSPRQALVAQIAVGFRLATYKQGSIEVVSFSKLESPEILLPNISLAMIEVAILFEQLVKASGILPYNPVTNTGNWRTLMLRTAGEDDSKQMMLVAILDPTDMSREQIENIRSDLVTFFTEGAGKSCSISSIYLHLSPAKKMQGEKESVPELLHGESVIIEKLFNLSFSVSPQAFFQVNTKACEVLYRTAGELANLDSKSTLVDVCCGTGTIGICLADKVKKVIGVELVAEAVRDARKNAESNDVKNCVFFAGRAEHILLELLRDIDSKEIVAIVDPPRAGLHNKALSAIRNTLAIKRLVYISCDAKNAMKNFVDLGRPESKTLKGDPFVPVKVIPVDMFPNSKQFELVLLFERISNSGTLYSAIQDSKEALQTDENVLSEEIKV